MLGSIHFRAFLGAVACLTLFSCGGGEKEPTSSSGALQIPTRSTAAPPNNSPATPVRNNAAARPDQVRAELLSAHNEARSLHGVPPLSWSVALEAEAAIWANRCEFRHSGAGGENLAHSTGSTSPRELVRLWFDEESDYDYQRGAPKRPAAVVGHFTQMVWQGTRQLGCGIARCPSLGTYLVCRYDPPGNVIGFYTQNVFPPR